MQDSQLVALECLGYRVRPSSIGGFRWVYPVGPDGEDLPVTESSDSFPTQAEAWADASRREDWLDLSLWNFDESFWWSIRVGEEEIHLRGGFDFGWSVSVHRNCLLVSSSYMSGFADAAKKALAEHKSKSEVAALCRAADAQI